MIEVRATMMGYFGNPGERQRIIEKGEKFFIADEKLYSKEWMAYTQPRPALVTKTTNVPVVLETVPPSSDVVDPEKPKRKYTRK